MAHCFPLWVNLTHCGWDNMAAIFQMTFLNGFSWIKMYEFQLKFHWCLFLEPTRWQAITWTNDGLHHWHIYASFSPNELKNSHPDRLFIIALHNMKDHKDWNTDDCLYRSIILHNWRHTQSEKRVGQSCGIILSPSWLWITIKSRYNKTK